MSHDDNNPAPAQAGALVRVLSCNKWRAHTYRVRVDFNGEVAEGVIGAVDEPGIKGVRFEGQRLEQLAHERYAGGFAFAGLVDFIRRHEEGFTLPLPFVLKLHATPFANPWPFPMSGDDDDDNNDKRGNLMSDDDKKDNNNTVNWHAIASVAGDLGYSATLVDAPPYIPDADPATEQLASLLDQLGAAIGFALGALDRLARLRSASAVVSTEALDDFITARDKARALARALPIAPRPEGGIDLSRLPDGMRVRFEHQSARLVGIFLDVDRGTPTISAVNLGPKRSA